MSEDRTICVEDHGSAISLLRNLESHEGPINLTIDFGLAGRWAYGIDLNNERILRLTLMTEGPSSLWSLGMKDDEKRKLLLARIYEALKVSKHVREMKLINMDDLGVIDEILACNRTITKLAIHDQTLERNPTANVDVLCRLVNRGPQIELHFSGRCLDVSHFATAISEHSRLTSLSITDRGILGKDVEKICNAIQRCSILTKLDLSQNWLDQAGSRTIGTMLKENSTLTELLLRRNQLGPLVGFIFEGLTTNSSLKKLDLADNDFDGNSYTESFMARTILRNTTLTELCFLGNEISELFVFRAMQANTTLTKFEFSCGRDARRPLGEMIQGNSTLTEITIHQKYTVNNFGEDLLESLENLLLGNQTFTEAYIERPTESNIAPTISIEDVNVVRALLGNQTLCILDFSGLCLDFESIEAFGDVLVSNTSLVRLTLAAAAWGEKMCERFGEGLKTNCTLKTLVFHQDHGLNDDSGPTTIADALAVNTGLENVTLACHTFSPVCSNLLVLSLQANNTLKDLVLRGAIDFMDGAPIRARGLVLSTSLTCLDLESRDCEGATILVELTINSLEELKVRSIEDQEQVVAFANILKTTTTLKRLYLPKACMYEGRGKEALMDAYKDNAALTCDILQCESGKSVSNSWYDYRLNQIGRTSWEASTFPSTLWAQALVLADLRSSPDQPDLLFHVIVTRPDIFKDSVTAEA